MPPDQVSQPFQATAESQRKFKSCPRITSLASDFEKFYDKEVGAAGTRVRKHLQELAKLCKETRNDVTAVKNARKEPK